MQHRLGRVLDSWPVIIDSMPLREAYTMKTEVNLCDKQ